MLQQFADDGPVVNEPEINDTGVAPRLQEQFDAFEREDLCDALLDAFVAMASRSRRRQADLSAALARSRLRASPDAVREAMDRLLEGGCIRDEVTLYDGGVLVTVTNTGMDRTGRNPHWRFLEKLRRRTG